MLASEFTHQKIMELTGEAVRLARIEQVKTARAFQSLLEDRLDLTPVQAQKIMNKVAQAAG